MAEPSPSSGRDEIVSLRTATAKFFREADGSRTAQVYAGPIHFRARDGSWTEIDSTLVPSPLPRFAWQNRRGPVTFAFAAAAGEAELVRVREGSLTIGFGLAGASPLSVGVVDDNRITYPDVFPGIDLRFEVQGENLKQALILRRAPSSSLAFQFPLFLEGLVPRPEASGEVALVARDGTVAFRIPRGDPRGLRTPGSVPVVDQVDVALSPAPDRDRDVLVGRPALQLPVQPDPSQPFREDQLVAPLRRGLDALHEPASA